MQFLRKSRKQNRDASIAGKPVRRSFLVLLLNCFLFALLIGQPARSVGQVSLGAWMAQQGPIIQTIPLKGIAMPGSHDTFSYVTGAFSSYDETQDLDVAGQLNAGIRHLDMRTYLLDSNGNIVGNGHCAGITNALPFSGAGYYMHAHGLCTGVRLEDALDQVSSYLDRNPQEIIVLHFSGTIQAGSPNYQTSTAFEAVLDQHLRRASDNASYIYNTLLACRFSGQPWTPNIPPPCFETAPYAAVAYGGVPPQNVTPQQLYTTSARVIVIEEYGLAGSGFNTPPDSPTLTWFSGNSEYLHGYSGTGASDIGTLNSWLEYRTPDGAPGLYADRPIGVGYEHDSEILTLQADLTPFGGIPGPYFYFPPMPQAQNYNPQLAALLDSTWNGNSVNVVQVDYVEDCLSHPNPGTCGDTVALDIVNFNKETFGRVPFGLTGASQISVGHNGSVYKLGFTDGSGPAPQSHGLAKLTGSSGYYNDWTALPVSASRIAADPSGGVWALDSSGLHLTYVNAAGSSLTMLSSDVLQDIAVDNTGALWAVGINGVPLQANGSSLGGYYLNWKQMNGITNVQQIAANNSVVAVLGPNGALFEYTGNGNWTFLGNEFQATSLAIDDAGNVWATQAPQAVGAYGGYTPAASTGLWARQGSAWQRFRTDGVQVATGYQSQGVDAAYVVDNAGNIHSLKFGPATGTGVLQSGPPPKRYSLPVAISGLVYSHSTQLFNGTLTVTNDTGSPITDQLAVLFEGLPSGVTIANNPLTYQGEPFILVPPGTLQPGASVSTQVQFKDPELSKLTYSNIVYAYVTGS